MTVGDVVARLVAVRMSKDILQSTVARRMGVPRSQVSHFETGKYASPTLATTLRYAAAVGARVTVEPTPTTSGGVA
ncbi:helix-turn-helix domain-containing protein [Mycolicibacterium fortuitum]|uniref:helix-turn-helix domain-containing protein n=1 Tax=Mycolicibacterium fortuitum TaxID=1766 RepID=UPI00261C1222|nr:helix-turn-helix transcriptional regulator [Mycolicibacterium fortuitum]